MGCRCGQNRRSQPAGAVTYSPPTPPPDLRGFPAGVMVQQPAPLEWYRVDVPRKDGGTDSVWWSTTEEALAFAAGRYPVTRTSTPPPSPVG